MQRIHWQPLLHDGIPDAERHGNDEEQSGGNRDVSACDRHGDHDRYHAPGSVFAGHAGGKAQTCEKMLKTGMAYAIISKVAVIYA